MSKIKAQKLLRIVEAQRWWRFCWPKKLWVAYKVLPQYADRCVFSLSFYLKERRFCINFYQKIEEEELDYKFIAKAFFKAYRRNYEQNFS